jgi:hypothetical protein
MFWPPVLPAAVASPSPFLPQLPGKNNKASSKNLQSFSAQYLVLLPQTENVIFQTENTDLDPGILLTPDPDQSGSEFRYRPRFIIITKFEHIFNWKLFLSYMSL